MRALQKPLLVFMAGIIVGLGVLAGWRFATYSTHAIHYHANFAVYVNGKREHFKSPTYYEDEAACTTDEDADPRHHAHMHDGVNDVVHVHAKGVTWGQFFENIGWSISKYHLQTRSHVFTATGSKRMNFMLNGRPVDDASGLVINSEDKLLVSYDSSSRSQLDKQYHSVPSTAHEENQSTDPASCGGSAPIGWRERLKNIFN